MLLCHPCKKPFWLDSESDTIYHSELFTLTKMARGAPTKISFNIPIFDPHPPQYYIRAVSDSFLLSFDSWTVGEPPTVYYLLKAVSDSWLLAESIFTVYYHNLTLPLVNLAISYVVPQCSQLTVICWTLHVFPADTNNTHWPERSYLQTTNK